MWTSFHVLIGHPCILPGEMSIQSGLVVSKMMTSTKNKTKITLGETTDETNKQ
jgi:hypothetical protein